MGKHEAPAPENNRRRRAAASSKKAFDWKLPEIKLPEIKLPELPVRESIDKLKNVFTTKKKEVEEAPLNEDLHETAEEGAPAAAENASEPIAEAAPAVPVSEAELSEEPTEEKRIEAEEEPEQADDVKPKFKLNVDLSGVRAFFEKLAAFGVSEEARRNGSRQRSYALNRDHVGLTAGSAVLFFLLWLLPTTGWLRFILYLIPLGILAWSVVLDAVGEVLDKHYFGRNLLICVAALGFLCLGQAHASVFVLLLHRVFLLLESYLFEKRASLADRLQAMLPDSAVAETEEGLERRDPHDFSVDEILYVPAGDVIALDGIVVDGISTLDTSALAGGSATEDVGVHSYVCAGCKNVTNPLRIRVLRCFEESTVNRYAARIRAASESEPSRSVLLQNILSYLPMALAGLGLLIGLIVSVVTGEWSTWIYRGLVLITLAACGDTLLSARMAAFTGVFDAAKEGILYKDTDVIDRYAGSDLMVFSKTGTVTEGKYSVVGVYPVDYDEKDLLTIAALAECQSMHPIAQALRNACGIEIHHRSDITMLEETPGRGIHTLFGGRNVYVGNSTLLLDHNIVFEVPTHKGTVVHVAVDNKYAGCIVLSDRVRDGAYDAIEELRLYGIRAAVMLTGDVRSMARPIASSLSFDMVKCELSNEAKLEALNYLRDSKGNNAAISYVSSKAEDLDLIRSAEVSVAFSTLTEREPMDAADLLIPDGNIFQLPLSLLLAKKIRMSALLCGAIMLAIELILVILSLTGAMTVWLAMLLILLARIGTLVYAIYFK